MARACIRITAGTKWSLAMINKVSHYYSTKFENWFYIKFKLDLFFVINISL